MLNMNEITSDVIDAANWSVSTWDGNTLTVEEHVHNNVTAQLVLEFDEAGRLTRWSALDCSIGAYGFEVNDLDEETIDATEPEAGLPNPNEMAELLREIWRNTPSN